LSVIYLFAVDAGPAQALSNLALNPDFVWANCDCVTNAGHWRDFFATRGTAAGGIIVGTSRSDHGAFAEAQCRLAAKQMGLPIIAIEDYPGNYQHVAGGAANLLIVESSLAARAARWRLGDACPTMESGASFRYDIFRNTEFVGGDRAPASCDALLWAGQPETEDALISLYRLLPHISALGMKLLFRAHSRDFGYSSGAYRRIFALYPGLVRDVSTLDLETIIGMRPRLTLTHFSSLAIALGFLGIPSIHVLFADAGGARLLQQSEYDTPHICEVGGSVKISTVLEIEQFLARSVFDQPSRYLLMQRFNAFYDVVTPQLPFVISSVERFFRNK
jgi:hypothetical protein